MAFSLFMPQLEVSDTTSLNDLTTSVLIAKQLDSQGFCVALNNSCAYSHESSIPLAYFREQKRDDQYQKLNMDRGGFVKRADDSHAACIADGAGGGGPPSAFLANEVTKFFLERLAQNRFIFTDQAEKNKEICKKIFYTCAETILKRNPICKQGATTALFVESLPLPAPADQRKMYQIQGAALGDGVLLHIQMAQKKVFLLNKIERASENDTGGCIQGDGTLYAPHKIVPVLLTIAEDDFIVLGTDGLFDNIRDKKVCELVEFVAFHSFFDQPQELLQSYSRPWALINDALLPTVDDLKMFVNIHKKKAIAESLPTAEQITKRLANYVALVTDGLRQIQESHYKYRLHEASEIRPFIASLSNAKTDDCMIITISPATPS